MSDRSRSRLSSGTCGAGIDTWASTLSVIGARTIVVRLETIKTVIALTIFLQDGVGSSSRGGVPVVYIPSNHNQIFCQTCCEQPLQRLNLCMGIRRKVLGSVWITKNTSFRLCLPAPLLRFFQPTCSEEPSARLERRCRVGRCLCPGRRARSSSRSSYMSWSRMPFSHTAGTPPNFWRGRRARS